MFRVCSLVGLIALLSVAFWAGVGSVLYVEHATPIRHAVRAARTASWAFSEARDIHKWHGSHVAWAIASHKFCENHEHTCELFYSLHPRFRALLSEVVPDGSNCSDLRDHLSMVREPLLRALEAFWVNVSFDTRATLRLLLFKAAEDDLLWSSSHLVAEQELKRIVWEEVRPIIESALKEPEVLELRRLLVKIETDFKKCGLVDLLVSSIGDPSSKFWKEMRALAKEAASSSLWEPVVLEAHYDETAVTKCKEMASANQELADVCKIMSINMLRRAQIANDEPEENIRMTMERLSVLIMSVQEKTQALIDNDESWNALAKKATDKFNSALGEVIGLVIYLPYAWSDCWNNRLSVTDEWS